MLMSLRFVDPLVLNPGETARLPQILADVGVAGGATYDAIVALAALRNGCVLATRDARALPTYQAVGVSVELAG